MDSTIAMLLSNHSSDGLFNHSAHKRPAPVSLKNTQDDYRPGDIVMSHWEIDRCIGRGSIGSVYEAHHIGSQYKSAIKVVSSEIKFSPIDVLRFFENVPSCYLSSEFHNIHFLLSFISFRTRCSSFSFSTSKIGSCFLSPTFMHV